MHAFLLAAGKGSRISKNIPEVPKSTLDVGGIPLILRTVEMLEKNGIGCTIVVGYKHQVIEDILKDTNVEIIYNPFFDVTNSIGSLYLAKDSINEEDIIIANADVFWYQDILDLLLSANEDVVMLSDKRRVQDGDYFFGTENGIIKRYGKNLTFDERDCEYVGIAKIKSCFVPVFKNQLIKMVSNQEHNVWWENVLYSLTEKENIYALDVNELFWAEVDFIEDYKRILDYVKSNYRLENDALKRL